MNKYQLGIFEYSGFGQFLLKHYRTFSKNYCASCRRLEQFIYSIPRL